jgi:hypothetical protein
VTAAWQDCWTARHHLSQLPTCAPHCSCKVWRAALAGGAAPRQEGADKREAVAGGKAEVKKKRKVAKMPEDSKGETIEKGDETWAGEGNIIETRKSTARKTPKVNSQNNYEETEGASKISPREKQDTKYTKLQRKYETMQIKLKAMKKDHAMKNQLKNLQQKYKALQEEVKGLKKESVTKTATSPDEVVNQTKPERRITRAAEAAALEASGAKPPKQEMLQVASASRGRFALSTRTRAKAKPSPPKVKPAGQEPPVRRKRSQG